MKITIEKADTKRVVIRLVKQQKGKYGDFIVWSFQEITTHQNLTGFTPITAKPNNKLYRWLSTLLGRDKLRNLTSLDTSHLPGTICDVTIDAHGNVSEISDREEHEYREGSSFNNTKPETNQSTRPDISEELFR